MGQVLRLPRPRRPVVTWSAVRFNRRIEILVQWRDQGRAGCAVHVMTVDEWDQLPSQALYFWHLIEHLRDMVIERGARF